MSATTALTRGCHSALLLARQPRVCAFPGQCWSPPGFGILCDRLRCLSPPSAWLLWLHVRQAGQRLGVVLQVPWVPSVPESWCHSSATWPCVPHACARPINQHFWAMVQQLPNQALGSPRYSCPPQLRILGCPDLNCWRSFLSSGELPVERQCVLKRWWIAETLPGDA